MAQRIPHTESPTETRQAFQHLTLQTDVITTGTSGYILVAQGVNVAPVWQTIVSSIDHGSIGGLGDDDHTQYHNDARGDARYFQQSEHLNTSVGAGDAGKPIKLDANGHLDATMLNDADVDHGSIGGLGDDDHTIYSLADGTRDFSGVVVGVDPTASNHLATKEYVDQVVSFVQDFFFNNTVSDIGGGSYYQMEELPTGEASGDFPTGPLGEGDGQALTAIFATEAGYPGTINLEHGVYTAHVHVARTVGNRPTRIYYELWRYETSGPTETKIATSEISDLITTGIGINLHATLTTDVDISVTDRLLIKFFANLGAGAPTTVVIYTEGSSSSRLTIPTSTEILSSIFLRQDGTKALTGNMSVDAGITIDGRDISVDGGNLDTAVAIQGRVGIDSGATPGYLGAASNDGALRTGAPLTYTDGGDYVTLDVDQTDVIPSLTNNNAGTVVKCQAVYCDANDGFDLAQADGTSTPEVIGLVASTTITSAAQGDIRTDGILTATTVQWDAVTGDSSGLTAGTVYFLDDGTAGGLRDTEPSLPGSNSVRIGIALSTTDMRLSIASSQPAGAEIITSNMTIYITTGGNDVSGDSTESLPWATLSQALSSLADKIIAAGVIVTIQFGDGTYVRTATDEITHVNGDKINIVGENTYDLTLSSIQSSSGSSGAWAIILNVNDVSNAAVDDFLLVPWDVSGGTRPETLSGNWKITNVDVGNTRLTVTSTHRHTSAPSGAVSGTVTLVKAILQYNGVGGIIVKSKLGLLDKLVLSGDGNGYGLLVEDLANATGGGDLGVNYFDVNVRVENSAMADITDIKLSNSVSENLQVIYSLVFAVGCVLSGGGSQAALVFASTLASGNCTISGNGGYGVYGPNKSFSSLFGAKITYNTTFGVYSSGYTLTDTRTGTVTNNGTNYNPAVNTLGNIQSYNRG